MTTQKLSWNPCGVCDEKDGLKQSSRHQTPGRFNVTAELFFAMNDHEKAALAAASDKQICGKCRNRLYMRTHRRGLRDQGLPITRPLMREWKP